MSVIHQNIGLLLFNYVKSHYIFESLIGALFFLDKPLIKIYNIRVIFLADVAHPVERHLAKVEVASSSLVIRSMKTLSADKVFNLSKIIFCLCRLWTAAAPPRGGTTSKYIMSAVGESLIK